jgi:lambda family phage portal protein
MAIAEKLLVRALRAAGAVSGERSYAAAKQTRLTNDWLTDNSSQNQELRMSLRVMRARSRQLARDDDYMKGFLDKLVTNVVGTDGITLQANAKMADGSKLTTLNKAVEEAWADWSTMEMASVTGQDSWRDIQALALRIMAVDGESVIRIILDPASPYGFALQFLDSDWLDEDFNDPNYNGNRIIMSVEVDQYDKPIAYWFTEPRWNRMALPGQVINNTPTLAQRIRIPASQIIHLFIKTRPGQVRGMVWAHTAMLRLNMLNGYEEAELVGQRIGASYMAFAVPPTDESGLGAGNQNAPIEEEVSPGVIGQLPAGYNLQVFDPKRPGTTYSVFVKSVLRAIAVGLGISYNSLASDLESTSYSSMRAGSLEDRDTWRALQKWMAEHLCQQVFKKWLVLNLGSAIKAPATALKQLIKPIWRGRGFDWVDPSKDTKADVEALNAGLKTRTEILAERGRDFEATMEEFAHEAKIMEQYDLQFGVDKEAVIQEMMIGTQAQADQATAKASAQAKPKPKPAAK